MKRAILFLALGLILGPLINIALNRPIDYILGLRPAHSFPYASPLVFWQPFELTRNIQPSDAWTLNVDEFQLFPIKSVLHLGAADFKWICKESGTIEAGFGGVNHKFFSDKKPRGPLSYQFHLTDKADKNVEAFIRTHGEAFYGFTNTNILLTVEFASPYIYDLEEAGYRANEDVLNIYPLADYGDRLEEAFTAINHGKQTEFCNPPPDNK